MLFPASASGILIHLQPHFSFPSGAVASEQIVLRWMHFIFGIIWIGLLYFFVLIGNPTMKQLEPQTRVKIYPRLMERAMGWFRWSALVTVVVGLRYYILLLTADAQNLGQSSLAWRWLWEWLVVWMIAYALIYALQLPTRGVLSNPWLRTILIGAVVIAGSYLVLDLNSSPKSSNGHLSISVGGGLGLIMLLNTWGVVWRVQKKMIAWTRAAAENGAPLPPESERLMRWAQTASRVGFWLSFPMLFFMAAAEHYPFLTSLTG
ncbi:MAG: urate hydroxylase PuuD [Candidatus Acidiferrales bacterium]